MADASGESLISSILLQNGFII